MPIGLLAQIFSNFLAGAFGKAMVTSAGTAFGTYLVESITAKFDEPDDKEALEQLKADPTKTKKEEAVEKKLFTKFSKDPAFTKEAQSWLVQLPNKDPELAFNTMKRVNNRFTFKLGDVSDWQQQLYDWSNQHVWFKETGKCPVNAEQIHSGPILFAGTAKGVRYFADGTYKQEIDDPTYKSGSFPHAVASCSQNHRWWVFSKAHRDTAQAKSLQWSEKLYSKSYGELLTRMMKK